MYRWKFYLSLEFLIFSVASSNSFRIYFIKKNSSWLIFESIKALEIRTSTLFNLGFANDDILSCFFLFFLIIDLYLLILAVTTQNYNPIAELVIPIETLTKEATLEMETHPVTVEIKTSKCSL